MQKVYIYIYIYMLVRWELYNIYIYILTDHRAVCPGGPQKRVETKRVELKSRVCVVELETEETVGWRQRRQLSWRAMTEPMTFRHD